MRLLSYDINVLSCPIQKVKLCQFLKCGSKYFVVDNATGYVPQNT